MNEKTVISNFVEADIEEEDWSDRKLNIYFTEDMKEVDEIIVDCGAPKTLVGERYLKLYMRKHNLIDADLEKMTCKQRFKFGPSQVYTSTDRAKIPIIMKVKDEYIKKIVDAFIIQAEVPFLLGMNTMKQWDTMLDMVSEELFLVHLE